MAEMSDRRTWLPRCAAKRLLQVSKGLHQVRAEAQNGPLPGCQLIAASPHGCFEARIEFREIVGCPTTVRLSEPVCKALKSTPYLCIERTLRRENRWIELRRRYLQLVLQ